MVNDKSFYRKLDALCQEHSISGFHIIMQTPDTMGCYAKGIHELIVPTMLEIYRDASIKEIKSWAFAPGHEATTIRGAAVDRQNHS